MNWRRLPPHASIDVVLRRGLPMRRVVTAVMLAVLLGLAGCAGWTPADPHDPHVNRENHRGYGP
jgi:hypothetical protein